jgi:hypothetical protein
MLWNIQEMRNLLFVFAAVFSIPECIFARKIPPVPWEASWSSGLWFKASTTELEKNPFVAEGSPFESPRQSYGLLLQENFKVQKADTQWVFRPSIAAKQEQFIRYPLNGYRLRSKIDGKINELFVQSTLNSAWIVAIGLQNFQWGPAEIMSPSNPLFHLALDSQDSTYQPSGHNLLRLNYSPSDSTSLVSLIEISKNEEPEFIAGEEFVPKGLFKAEYRLPIPTDYLGFTVGTEQRRDSFFGGYGNITFFEMLSAYFDIKHLSPSKRYFPVLGNNPLPTLILTEKSSKPARLAVFGLRIELENIDLRWEEIINDLGLSQNEMELAALAMSPLLPDATNQQNRFLHSGRELVSKNYSYLSARIPHFLKLFDSTLALRLLQSHRDDTGQATLSWEGSWRDNWTFFINSQVTYGKKAGELTLLYKNRLNSGIKYSW